MTTAVKTPKPLNIAVVGTGISGLSAAWLLSRRHTVTVYEAADRIGGHTNTIDAPAANGGTTPVDTGFIVYNELNYPNLVALFAHLGVETRGSDMSFAVSLDGGSLEYGSTNLKALFAQKRNILRPRFWSMLRDLQRFYRSAPNTVDHADQFTTLGDYLSRHGYGTAFQNDHLLPQASAIWSSDIKTIQSYPISSFVRFFQNHGLLEIDINARPQWRTVVGGSRAYIPSLTAPYADRIRLGTKVKAIARGADGVTIQDGQGATTRYDHVVIAAHAPQALAMLMEPTAAEHQVLGAIRYTPNTAVLHTDTALMPRRRAAWSAWNYVGASGGKGEVTYWMNRLQGLSGPEHYLVSLNPPVPPKPECLIATEHYEHPLFDVAAGAAQRRLWSLQGVRNTWFCGAYFGAGFHEDGLQSGLAVAEALGGVRRPWTVENESGRIFIDPRAGESRVNDAPSRSALYEGRVWHRRFKPREHKLAYRIPMLLLDLDELPTLDQRLRLFSHNRFNLMDFRERDHLDGSPTALKAQVDRTLADAGYQTGGRVRLLCMPRVLGSVFNPLSVYFCEAPNGRLQAILYEVNNTFGQRHSYLLRAEDTPGAVAHGCEKRFYVSPFNDLRMTYDFRVVPPGDLADDQPLSVRIDVRDAEGLLMTAAFVGEREPLTDKTLLAAGLRHPLLMAKMLGAIHWEALKLWLKGVKLTPRPPAPKRPVTTG